MTVKPNVVAFVQKAKDKPCADCGHSYPFYVMQFDHRPGEVKLFSLGSYRGKSYDKIIAEMAKCDLVCANCHATRTYLRQHGLLTDDLDLCYNGESPRPH